MPWKVSDPVSVRLQFVQRWQDGERVVDLCREFGISRKTAYKILARFKEEGPRGLYDRSTIPHSKPNKTPPEVEKVVVALRRQHPTWGPKKLFAWLVANNPDLRCEARVLGLLAPRKARWERTMSTGSTMGKWVALPTTRSVLLGQ